MNFRRSGNYLFLNIKIPKLFIKSNYKYFTQYSITYLRPNGYIVTQMRSNLPRVVEFTDNYVHHEYYDYIGCYNGLGWKIISIKLVDCKYRS